MNKLLTDQEILNLVTQKRMIYPFADHLIRLSKEDKPVISYGLSSFGYDIRLADEFYIMDNANRFSAGVIDPKDQAGLRTLMYKVEGQGQALIPPGSFVLGVSMETFKMPQNVLGICLGKSTYARCGVNVHITPLEPGWTGQLTIEISNNTPHYAKIYAGEGIAQILFYESETYPHTPYNRRSGKYQDQVGVVFPKV